jgi:predicted nucleic acid-binding protein
MRIRSGLSVDDEALAAFCRHHGIRRTYEDLSRFFRNRVRAAAVPLYAAA